jgi:flavin reductase (DIM6/NTAB) family NADH-FMN oxidoreductase RutF
MHTATNNTSLTFTNHERISANGHNDVIWNNLAIHEAHRANTQRQEFINAMGVAVTGVNLITTDGRAGRFGITVSSMSSVSADPPMLLACVNRHSPACSAIRSNQVYCVNVLSTTQRHLADSFAGKTGHAKPYDFSIGEWLQSSNDAPRLANATSSFDCVLVHAYDAGSHTIFVARVTSATEGSDSPLLYTDRNYGFPCRSE